MTYLLQNLKVTFHPFYLILLNPQQCFILLSLSSNLKYYFISFHILLVSHIPLCLLCRLCFISCPLITNVPQALDFSHFLSQFSHTLCFVPSTQWPISLNLQLLSSFSKLQIKVQTAYLTYPPICFQVTKINMSKTEFN